MYSINLNSGKMSQNQFLFKIELDSEGNSIELDNMTLDATTAFLKIAGSIIKLLDEYKQNDTEDNIRVNIYKSSSALAASFTPDIYHQFYNDFSNVSNHQLDDPFKCKKFRILQDNISEQNFRMSAYFIEEESRENVIHIFKGAKFKYVKTNTPIQSNINLFEKVYLNKIGGDTTYVELIFNKETDEVKKTDIRVKDIDLALGLRGCLYQNVYLLIAANNRYKFEIMDMYKDQSELASYNDWFNYVQSLYGIDRYKAFLDKIRQELGRVDSLQDKKDLLYKHCILFMHKKIESGMFRTILMTLKPFKNDYKIEEMFNEFITLYKKSTKRSID